MIVDPVDETVGVGVAARADDVVDARAVRVEAVPVERVVGDRRHRPQIGERAPEAVAPAHMGRVERARLAAEKAFGEIGGVPQVEVADLRPLDADDAKEMPGRDIERPPLAWRDDRLADLRHAYARIVGECGGADRRAFVRVDDNRLRGPAKCCIWRWRRLGQSGHGGEGSRSDAARKGVAPCLAIVTAFGRGDRAPYNRQMNGSRAGAGIAERNLGPDARPRATRAVREVR